MPAFTLRHTEGRYLDEGPIVLTAIIINLSMKTRTNCSFVIISIRAEIVRLVRVRAYKRIRHGRIERVRSHFRMY